MKLTRKAAVGRVVREQALGLPPAAGRRFASCLLAWLLASIVGRAPAQTNAVFSQTKSQNGAIVKLEIERAKDASKAVSGPLREFEKVVLRVNVNSEAAQAPIPGGAPAAWMDRKASAAATPQEQCVGKIKRFAEGSTFSRSELDLTSYVVLIMNNDATLSVVDPRFGYGDTRLLAMVTLQAPAEDWALTEDGKRLFVSVPDASEVVAVDTIAWQVTANVASLRKASRLALQPDEAYVWVGYGDGEADSGVAAIRTRDMKIAARIPTGRGYHQMAFTADSAKAFVTNPGSGTVSIIDVRKLTKLVDVRAGDQPSSIAYSDLAKAAVVANHGDGNIVVIDAAQNKVRARIQASPGLGQVRFVPGGRFALAVNPTDNKIYVVDASSNRIVQRGALDKGPDQIAFTNKTVHVRHRDSDNVLMIPIQSIGQEGADISVADFSGGRHAPGQMTRPTPADGIVQASGENAVLVANPGDRSIYLYMEGSAAPMGNLTTYGHEPRAVLSVERNLRERRPGVYETSTTLPAAGPYDLALFLDQPRFASCFDFVVAPDPTLHRAQKPPPKIESQVPASVIRGRPAHLAFKTNPEAQVADLVILVVGAGWQHRQLAQPQQNGIYAADFNIPVTGIYRVLVTAPSLGLPFTQYGTMTVTEEAR